MITNITNLLDRANILQQDRGFVCRILARVIFGIASYNDERPKMVNFKQKAKSRIAPESESQIWEWIRDISWDRRVATCYWRALGCLLHTKDISKASHENNVALADLWYLFDQLTGEDIDAFINRDRNWRAPSIDERTINEVVKLCRGTINHCVFNLRFVWQYDPAHPKEDWEHYFVSEAVQTIYRYEDRHSLGHLVNTVKTALENKCRIMQCRYSSVKQGSLINSSKLGGSAVQQFISRRADLMIDSPDGSETENPELFSRSTRTEPSIDTELFIRQVARDSEALAKYLRLVVLDDDNTDFVDWLDKNDLSIDSNGDLHKSAAMFCGLKRDDLRHLRRIAEVDYPIGQQMIKKAERHRAALVRMQRVEQERIDRMNNHKHKHTSGARR